MKLTNLIFILVSLTTLNVFAQNAQHKVEYDFKTKEMLDIKPVKLGESSILKIININTFKYEVEIRSSQSEFNSSPSQIFSILNREIIENNKQKDNLNIFDKKKSGGGQENYLKESIVETIFSDINEIFDAFYQLEKYKILKNSLIDLALMPDAVIRSEFLDELDRLLKKYNYDDENFYELLLSFQKKYNHLKRDLLISKSNLQDKFDPKEVEEILKSVSEIDEIKQKVDEYDYQKLFKDNDNLIRALKSENSYSYVSDPLQAKKDIIKYQVKITPRKGIEGIASVASSETRNFEFEVPVKGGIKIDFSTGLFITTNLQDRKYTKTLNPTDTSQSIITENKNNSLAQLTFGALMHISPRCTGNFKPGFTFGLGLNSTELSNAQIFVGGSAIFGSAERFIVSTGVSLANVDYLNGKYSLDTPIKNSVIGNSLTEKSVRAGWFISFTYNLTQKKKE